MNYREFISHLSERTGYSKSETKSLLKSTLRALEEQLAEGTSVSIPNLGTFDIQEKEQRKIYNPHYDSYMLVPPKRTVQFTPASGLKDEVKFLEIDNE